MIYTLTLNPALDRELFVESLEFDRPVRALKVHEAAGGKGINVSRMLKNLGIDSTTIVCSAGLTGQKLTGLIKAMGLDARIYDLEGETRINTSIVSRSGNIIKVNEPGPVISKTRVDDILDRIRALTSPDDLWILGGSLPPGVHTAMYADIIRIVQANGARAVLDTSGDALVSGCEARPFLVKPNAEEAEELTGISVNDQKSAQKAAQRIHKVGVSKVVISLGDKGALYSSRLSEKSGNVMDPKSVDNFTVYLEAPKINVKNPVGAGDALLAGILFGIVNNKDPLETLAWGISCGSAAAGLTGTDFGSNETVQMLMKPIIESNK